MWWTITVEKYQQIEKIQETTLDDIDRVAFLICAIYDKQPEKVNLWGVKKFLRYTDKISKLFAKQPTPFFQPDIQTDANKITLGQFIEMQHWLKGGVIFNLHFIAATLLKAENHQETANNVLKMRIGQILYKVGLFLESWQKLINSYANLFELDSESEDTPHPFIEQYGWIFSATKVSEHEGITLDQAFDLPILQALNDLAFLKSKQKFDKWQQEQ